MSLGSCRMPSKLLTAACLWCPLAEPLWRGHGALWLKAGASAAQRYSGQRPVTRPRGWHSNAKVDPLNKRCVSCTQPGGPHRCWVLQLGRQTPANSPAPGTQKDRLARRHYNLDSCIFPYRRFSSRLGGASVFSCFFHSSPSAPFLSASFSFFYFTLFPFISLQSRFSLFYLLRIARFTGYFIYIFPDSSPASAGYPQTTLSFLPTIRHATLCFGHQQQTGYSVILLFLLLKPDRFSSSAFLGF